MKPGREAALRWLRQAEHDLSIAHGHQERGDFSDACFMAEQAPRKGSKPFSSAMDTGPFPSTLWRDWLNAAPKSTRPSRFTSPMDACWISTISPRAIRMSSPRLPSPLNPIPRSRGLRRWRPRRRSSPWWPKIFVRQRGHNPTSRAIAPSTSTSGPLHFRHVLIRGGLQHLPQMLAMDHLLYVSSGIAASCVIMLVREPDRKTRSYQRVRVPEPGSSSQAADHRGLLSVDTGSPLPYRVGQLLRIAFAPSVDCYSPSPSGRGWNGGPMEPGRATSSPCSRKIAARITRTSLPAAEQGWPSGGALRSQPLFHGVLKLALDQPLLHAKLPNCSAESSRRTLLPWTKQTALNAISGLWPIRPLSAGQ